MHLCADRGTAIIGSGIAGLSCARKLIDAGHAVTVFDKGRYPGGRCASRARLIAGRQWWFDHGAQPFTARNPRFRDAVLASLQQGVLETGSGAVARGGEIPVARVRGEPRYGGLPRMHSWPARLAAAMPVQQGVEITAIEKRADLYVLRGAQGALPGLWSRVVLAMPAPQATRLLSEVDTTLAARVAEATLAPCWALLGVFPAGLAQESAVLRPTAPNPISWARRQVAPPGAETEEAWVIHASAEWSRAHLEESPATVQALLLAAWAALLGEPALTCHHAEVHRWRYALVERSLGEPCLWSPALQIGTCGDWHLGPRVEFAWTSGTTLAETILATASE